MSAYPSNTWDGMGAKAKDLLLMKLSTDKFVVNRHLSHEFYEEVEEELEENEVHEEKILQQEQVSNVVVAGLEQVQQQGVTNEYLSQASSVTGSLQSTLYQVSSLPESIDGGIAEVEELKNLPPGPEKSLKVNQSLQKRFSSILTNLQKAEADNKLRKADLRKTQLELKQKYAENKYESENSEHYHIKPSSFAMPYFKDRYGTPASLNKDALAKIDQGFLDLYSTKQRKWKTKDHNVLSKHVAENFRKLVLIDARKNRADLMRKLRNYDKVDDDVESLHCELKVCENHINFLEKLPAEMIEIPRDASLDWDEISAQGFDGYHSPQECYLYWRNYLHPSINKDMWTEEEDIHIQELVSEAGDKKPKWNDIAEALDTGRTGFQVMQRYASFIRPALQPANWDDENSKKLVDTVLKLRNGIYIPWTQVAQLMRGYTVGQCQTRWTFLNPEIIRGKFQPEEDIILVKGLYKFGMNWNLICHFIEGRTKIQVKQRYRKGLLPGLSYNPWKASEDRKIIESCSQGQCFWRKLGTILPKRNVVEIRLRYSVLQVWQSLLKQIKMPPPLFPLSLTVDPVRINDIRELIQDCKNEKLVNALLAEANEDLIRQREGVSPNFKPRKTRRLLNPPKKFKDETVDEIIQANKKNFRGIVNQSKITTWPRRAIGEFFLPGRPEANKSSYRTGPNAKNAAMILSYVFNLNISHPTSEEEVDHLPLTPFDEDDIEVVNELHKLYDPDGSCSCSIPLIPPNSLTIGALRSMLLHIPKLKEMAEKKFLFYHVEEDQLCKLGVDEKKGLQMIMSSQQRETTETDELLLQTGLKSEQCDDDELPAKRKRKAASMAENFTRKLIHHETGYKPIVKDQVFYRPPVEKMNDLMQNPHPPTTRTLQNDHISTAEIIESEDKLLFQRMLSLFSWPAMCTLKRPILPVVKQTERLFFDLEQEIGDDDETDENVPMPQLTELKWGGKYADMDIEEQEEKIAELQQKMKGVAQPQKRKYNDLDDFLDTQDTSSSKHKQKIINLKRSLIVKKVWSNRRAGLMPMPNHHAAPKPKTPRLSTRQTRSSAKQSSIE